LAQRGLEPSQEGSAISGRALCRRGLLYPLASLDVSGQWPVSALEPGL